VHRRQELADQAIGDQDALAGEGLGQRPVGRGVATRRCRPAGDSAFHLQPRMGETDIFANRLP